MTQTETTTRPDRPGIDQLEWLQQAQNGRDDPLLECLVFLTHFHGRPRSADVLTAGLPLTGARLTPKLFLRAAERVGLKARIVKRPVEDIPPLVLPAVIVTVEGDAGVIVARHEDHSLDVVWPTIGGAPQRVAAEELAATYSGFAILVRPMAKHLAGEGSVDGDGTENKSWFWRTIRLNRWIYAQVIAAAVVLNLFALAVPIFTMALYDRIIPNAALETLWVLAIGVAIVLFFDFLIKSLRTYFIETAGRKADVILACRLFDQVLDIRIAARPASAGGFAGTLREFETLRDFFTSATLATIVDLPFVLMFIGVLAIISGPVALLLLAAVPVIIGYGLLIQFPLNAVVRKHFQEGQDKHGVLVETINGLETIKGTGTAGRMRQLWESRVGQGARSGEMARTLSTSAVNFAAFLQQLTTVGVLVYGVHLVIRGDMTTGGLIACSILSGRAIAPLGQFAALLTRMNQALTSLGALNALMNSPTEREGAQNFLSRPVLSGALGFDQVQFTYPGRNVQALKGISFSIKAGEKVAIIGRVGSGKSTIARLLLNLYQPTEGTVTVDDVDIRQIDPVDLRRNIGYVGQEPFLFRGSLRDNISAAMPYAEDALVLHAAQLAGVDEFVRQTSAGYDLPVGERGEGLSGGQRQLVTIARALLRDPPILILDEPTSGMDARSEEALVARLKPQIKDKTMVLITHRGSLLSLADRVIIMDGGKVVADGPRTVVLEALAAGRISTAKA